MRKNTLIDFFRACKAQCEDETKDIRRIWEASFDQYMCRGNFGNKKKWQHKVYVPISKPKIKKAVRLIKRSLLQSGEYFDFENPPRVPEKLKLCRLTKRALKLYLDQANFIEHFSTALESGFTLAMMILKFWVAEDEAPFEIDVETEEIVYRTRPKLKCKPINPFNFWFTRDKKVIIEDEWVTISDLKKTVEGNGDIYNQNEVKRLINGDYSRPYTELDEEDKNRLQKLGLREHENKYRKEIKLSHFWGPITKPNGDIYIENAQMIVANDKYIILGPRENPFWHRKPPYVFGSPQKVIFRHIGKSLTEDVRGIENAIVEFVNLQLDNLMWKMLGIHEIDEMAFSDAGRSDLRELYPGKFVRKRSGYQGVAYKFHDIGVDPAQAMPMLQELKLFHEEEHGVTSYVEAVSGHASEKATIYAGKREMALGDFQSIAMDIERGFMAECIDMARDLMIQYLITFDNPDLYDIFRENEFDLAQLSETERRAMIVTDVNFIGKGISIFFEREALLQKIGAYVKMLNAMPEQAQLYPNWPVIIKRFNEAFAFDSPDEMIHTDEEVAKMTAQMEVAKQQQLLLQMQLMQKAHQQELEKIDRQNVPKLIEIQQKYANEELNRKSQIVKELLKSG